MYVPLLMVSELERNERTLVNLVCMCLSSWCQNLREMRGWEEFLKMFAVDL
jgi:hypothetical protein